MSIISTFLSVVACIISFFLTSATCYQFVSFLSQQRQNIGNIDASGKVLPPFLIDGWILILFIAQHSFIKLPSVVNIIKKIGLDVWQRTIYVMTTCLALQVLMRYWAEIGTYKLWEINSADSIIWWWTFFIVHSTCWIIIYGGCLIMDLSEIIGIKQVYYSIQGYQNPFHYKSMDLLRLYKHFRHPSVLPFAVILWFYPVMGLGRLFLAIVLLLYMILAFKPDNYDYRYQKVQIQQKKFELQCNFAS